MTTLIHTWPRCISISQELVARAKADFQQVDKQSLPELAHQPFQAYAFFFWGKATLFCPEAPSRAAEVLHYRGADDREARFRRPLLLNSFADWRSNPPTPRGSSTRSHILLRPLVSRGRTGHSWLGANGSPGPALNRRD